MLTDKIVKALKPTDRHQWVKPDHDAGDNPERTCRGFAVKVMRSGRKTYVVSCRHNGIEREFVIGDATEWSVGTAREKARQVRQQARDGRDPQGERVETR